MDLREKIEYVWNNTKILRNVEKNLFTFGDTVLPYFLIAELVKDKPSTFVKEGEVIIKRPLIYTPYQDTPHFKGFGEKEKEYSNFIIHRMAYIPPYTYQNASKSFYISSDNIEETSARLSKRLDGEGNNLTAIIKTMMDMWEVSVMRYSIERMVKSLPSNITELKERGLLG